MQDIEIYLRNADPTALEAWLRERFKSVSLTPLPNNGGLQGQVGFEDRKIPVRLFFNAAGKQFSSLWFQSCETPWEDDLACARDVHRALGIEVRCMAEGWTEGMEESDGLWWVIRDGEEKQRHWR